MANRRRGEVEIRLDGRPYTLCLTLGALAELETAFAAGDLAGLAERLGSRLSAVEALRLLAIALRGGGQAIEPEALAAMTVEGGALGLARTLADLLALTFAGADHEAAGDGEGAGTPRPFPGTR